MYEVNMALGKEIVENSKKDNNYGDKKQLNWFSIRNAGQHRVRVLPPFSASGNFGKSVYQFFNMPTLDPSKFVTHTCVEKTFPERGIRCPIMDVLREIDQLSQGGTKFKFDLWEAGPGHRYYANVLVRSSTNTDPINPNLIYVGNFPGSFRNWIWEKIMDPDWGNITHPINGRDIKITRKEENKRVSYDREMVPNQSPIITNLDEIEMFLKDLPNLDDIWSFPTDEILEKQRESASLYRESLLRKLGLISGNQFTQSAQPNVGFNPPPQQSYQQPTQNYQQNQQIPIQQPQYVPQPTFTASQPVQYATQEQQQQIVSTQPQYTAQALEPQQVVNTQAYQTPVQQPQQVPAQQPQVVTQQAPVVQAPPVQQVPPAVQLPVIQEPAKVSATKIPTIPSQAPECYGDPNVQSESNEKCQVCIFEFECAAHIKATNK